MRHRFPANPYGQVEPLLTITMSALHMAIQISPAHTRWWALNHGNATILSPFSPVPTLGTWARNLGEGSPPPSIHLYSKQSPNSSYFTYNL